MKKMMKKLWQDESAQGATEYILMLVVVVSIAMLFRDRIQQIVSGKVNQLEGQINTFN